MNTEKLIKEKSDEYGSPADNFSCIIELTNIVDIQAIANENICYNSRHALRMICIKLGRILTGKAKADNWDDIAGYAMIGKELQLDKETPDV